MQHEASQTPYEPEVLDRVYVIRGDVRRRDTRPNDGRCGNVAAALHAQFGWERQWGYLRLLDETVSWVHYWNRLPDGTIIDATADQFQDLWLGDVVILDGTDDHTSHYLHAPREWKLHFEDRDAAGTAADPNLPWLSLAHLVLQLSRGGISIRGS